MIAFRRTVRYFFTFGIALVAAITMWAPARSQSIMYPVGLQSDNVLGGIYPGTNSGNCCWMGPSATLRLRSPANADTLLLNIYLPPFAAQAGGQELDVRINGASLQRACCLQPGEHELQFRLQTSRPSLLKVRILARTTFIPSKRGLNQDPRELSVLIRGIAFLNTRSGERFDPAPAPQLPARIAWPVLVVFAMITLLATVRRPVFGVVALVISDPFLLAAYVDGTTMTLPKVALIAVVAGLAFHLRFHQKEALSRPLILLLAANVAVIGVMILASVHAPFRGAALRETLKAIQYLATIVVAYIAFRIDRDERVVRGALVTLLLAVVLPALLQARIGGSEFETIFGRDIPRVAGALDGPNQLAGFLGIVVPAVAAFAALRRAWTIEWIAVGLGVIACVLTFSRGGLAALVIALIALVLVTRHIASTRAIAWGTVGAYVVASIVAFSAFAGAHGTERIFSTSDRFNGGLGSRPDLWHAAREIWLTHPILGIGPGNFEYAVGRYDPGIRTHANGMFFQVLAEQGVLGLLAYLGLVYASVAAFARRLNEPLALGACLASVALAFHQIVDCIAIYPKVGVIWCVLLGIAAATAYASIQEQPDNSLSEKAL